MIHFVYEDADDTPFANLVKSYFAGELIIPVFVGGNANVRKYILAHDKAHVYVAFIDVIPDNPQTAKEFRSTYTKTRKYPWVFRIPVVCAEYYILKAFTNKNIPELYNVVADIDYTQFGCKIKSAEKYYKYFLDEQRDCLTLGNFRKCSKSGLFLASDCACPDCVCRIPRAYKAQALIKQYPVCTAQSIDFYRNLQTTRIARYNDLIRQLAPHCNWSPVEIEARLLY